MRHRQQAYEVTERRAGGLFVLVRSAADRRGDDPLGNIPPPTLDGMGFSGVALGLARASLEALMTLAEKKAGADPWRAGFCCATRGDRSRVAKATGRRQSGRAYLHDMLHEFWQAATANRAPTLEQRAHRRVAITGSMDQARRSPTSPIMRPALTRPSTVVRSSGAFATSTPSRRRARRICPVSRRRPGAVGIEPSQRL